MVLVLFISKFRHLDHRGSWSSSFLINLKLGHIILIKEFQLLSRCHGIWFDILGLSLDLLKPLWRGVDLLLQLTDLALKLLDASNQSGHDLRVLLHSYLAALMDILNVCPIFSVNLDLKLDVLWILRVLVCRHVIESQEGSRWTRSLRWIYQSIFILLNGGRGY